jgi:hypothetical protein
MFNPDPPLQSSDASGAHVFFLPLCELQAQCLRRGCSRGRQQSDHGALGRADSKGGVAPNDGRRRGDGGDGAEDESSGGVASAGQDAAAGLVDAVGGWAGGGLADEGGCGQGGEELETHGGSVRGIISLGVRGYRMDE